jgi:hypothetical protein
LIAMTARGVAYELVHVGFGKRHIDVHPSGHQRRDEVWANDSGLRRIGRAEGEAGHEGRAPEPVAEQLQQRHGVLDHAVHADVEPVVVPTQRVR